EELAKQGIEAEVIDPRTLVPLDKELIFESVRKTGKLLIVEEDNLTNGWGAEVAALAADEVFEYLDAPIKRVASPDVPPPFAPILEYEYLPNEQKIIAAVQSML
ncbi:MAG: alpha-ketoacid dehydrogenase subunit beta, partial [Desulfobacterales bacterium]|nr:alpha-ketoacid dehydrogenase subunit beta [Desulfobacterales bacterium]